MTPHPIRAHTQTGRDTAAAARWKRMPVSHVQQGCDCPEQAEPCSGNPLTLRNATEGWDSASWSITGDTCLHGPHHFACGGRSAWNAPLSPHKRLPADGEHRVSPCDRVSF